MMCILTIWLSVCMQASPHLHAIHDEWLSVCSSLFLRSDSVRVSLLHLPLVFHFYLNSFQVDNAKAFIPCPVAIHHPPTGCEPNLRDNFDYSETSVTIFHDESGDTDTEPSYSCDAELDDELIGKALSSPLFIQEREEPANQKQAYHFHD